MDLTFIRLENDRNTWRDSTLQQTIREEISSNLLTADHKKKSRDLTISNRHINAPSASVGSGIKNDNEKLNLSGWYSEKV